MLNSKVLEPVRRTEDAHVRKLQIENDDTKKQRGPRPTQEHLPFLAPPPPPHRMRQEAAFHMTIMLESTEKKVVFRTQIPDISVLLRNSQCEIQERMSRPQVSHEELHLSKEIILDEVQPSKETDLLINADSGDSSREDTISISSVSARSVSDEEKILSEIQEEKQILEELKVTMDKCLPIPLDMPNIQESSEEDGDHFRENSSRDKGYFTPIGSLPNNLQAYKHALENIRGTKNNVRKLLYQLYEATELTYQSKQGSEDGQNCHKVLFELWIKWCRSQSENVDGATQLLEALTQDISCSIALKLQSVFMDLLPQVQGLPSSIKDNLQQACCNMHEFHTTFSVSGSFEDLDKHYLTQSQFKLTQAQESIEKLFCFLEDGILSGWIVGPLSPSEYSFPEVITLPEEKAS
ncbi:perilipin-3-like [Trichosurus vulpecula]|uniref:perilipin-3-like n=1 Tax=Trichosurus vulpecula TaxID=9337 RepID=UPI00186B069B|nr:perilipin-3-like [Trichosurus vulpecula]